MRTRVVVAAAAGAAALLAAGPVVRHRLRRSAANWERCSAPSVALYDAGSSALLGGFFDLVVAQVVERLPAGSILEIGGGPGHLAVRLAGRAPALRIRGVDLDPAMVDRARERATRAGLADRVDYDVGDVAALPLADGSVDLVVSTFSMHHWADARTGLDEIHRVLRPGGAALIYDLAGWIRRFEARASDPLAQAAASSFGGGRLTPVHWPGPLVIAMRLDLVKAA